MRPLLAQLLLLGSVPAWSAEPPTAEQAGQAEQAASLLDGYARCYAYCTMSHFYWGSRNDRMRLRFYLERTELAFVYATRPGEQHGISQHSWPNSSLTHRNIMMSEIGQDLNRIATLGRSYETACEALMAQIPPEVVKHYETMKHDLRNEPQS